MQKAVLAYDIGGSKILAGLVTRGGEILRTVKEKLPPTSTQADVEATLFAHGEQLLQTPDVEVTAIGLNVPGLADPARGMWVYAPFSGIADYPIGQRLTEKFGLPVYLENDVNACAWAEKVYGCCREVDDYLWVTVSNGVGGGLVLGGKVYGGAFGASGEIGHVVVDYSPEARQCPCGHRGCLEAMGAGPGIAWRYAKAVGEQENPADAAKISQLAREGDPIALKVMEDTGRYVGRAMGAAAGLLNLPRYVLGGGVMESWDLILPFVEASFRETAFAKPNEKAEIVHTALGYEAGLMGAASLAWEPMN